MSKISLIILTIVALLIAGCSPAKSTSSTAGAFPETPREAESAPSPGKTASDSFAGQSVSNAVERIVIKNANLTIVVSDPSASMDTIAAMAESMGGFVVSSNSYKTQTDSGVEVPQASITVRVPVERLNEAIQKIKDETEKPENDVLNENVTGDDITQTYTDLQSRLRNLENARGQLENIMDKATNTQDVLATYNQLVSVNEQIEVLKGQIQYYDQAAALSAISVSILAKESIQPLTIGGWEPQGTARNAVQALLDTLKFLGNAIIWIVLLVIPILAVLYFIFFLPLRWLFRRLRLGRKPKAVNVPPAVPPAPQA